MHTNTLLVSTVPAPATAASVPSGTAANRRRRHLSVYRRALGAAKTPQQRAAVAARYRQLFAIDGAVPAPTGSVIQLLSLDAAPGRECRAEPVVAVHAASADLGRECRAEPVVAVHAASADLDRECREVTVTVAA